MSNLQLYNPEKKSLGEVSFIKDVSNQMKVRDYDSLGIVQQGGVMLLTIKAEMGITHEFSQFNKKDILKLLEDVYRNYSLDEIHYAFQLERFGKLGERIDHFHEFNSIYVDQVLKKYIEWKRELKKRHQIESDKQEQTISDEEKKVLVNSMMNKCLNHWEENRTILEGYVAPMYDEIYDLDLLPKDVKTKNKFMVDAKECIKLELQQKDLLEYTQALDVKKTLNELNKKGNGKVIMKAKELVLASYLRKIDENTFKQLKSRYS